MRRNAGNSDHDRERQQKFPATQHAHLHFRTEQANGQNRVAPLIRIKGLARRKLRRSFEGGCA